MLDNVAYEDAKYVVVPFDAFLIPEQKPHEIKILLNIDGGRLGYARRFDIAKDFMDLKLPANVYIYFSPQPYWTEGPSPKENPKSNWAD